MLSRNPG